MNIKMTTFVSTLALLLACSASAQMTTILPGGRGNLYIGTPTTLPGPMGNIVISPRINLPAPLLSPSVALTLSPVPMVTAAAIPVLPMALPSAIPVLPIALPNAYPAGLVYRVTAEPRALQQMHFAAPVKDAAPAKNVAAAREKLDNVFDGRKQPNEKSASDDLGPVRSDRHHSLPENDLEKEIGAY